MKLSAPQQFTLTQIAQAGEHWRYATDWKLPVVNALERRGLVELRSMSDGGWSNLMVRATPKGLAAGHATGDRF